jgi:putative (di)nucleoside polyphosphate hydrolase
MLAPDATVQTATTNCPEFDSWEWVSYWYPVDQVVSFKREVYRRAMKELCLRHSRLVYHQGLVIPSHTKRS